MNAVAPPAAGAPEFALSRRLAWRRMPWAIRACIAGAILIALAAIFAGALVRHDPVETDILNKLQPPFFLEGYDGEHLLGTDQLGRDLLARSLHGIRVSVGIAFVGLSLSFRTRRCGW